MTRRDLAPWSLLAMATAYMGLALAICSMSACASNTPDDLGALEFATKQARNRQLGLTALMALDTAQTVTIGRSQDCLFEANPLAAAIFGSRTPSPQRVIGTNAIYIAAHWLLGSYLDRTYNCGGGK